MGWDTSKVMGVWVVFHTIALGLIEVLRYWSQVGAWSFWSLELSVQGSGVPIYGLSCQVEVPGGAELWGVVLGLVWTLTHYLSLRLQFLFPGPLHYGPACTE